MVKGEEYYKEKAPLAERMRPATIEEFLGQDHLMGESSALRQSIESDNVASMILWGPPGSGKTTLGTIIASVTGREFVHMSAVLAGVKDIKSAVKAAKDLIDSIGRGTILFIDEIHRFNKSQQDALLPHVENGSVTLIGATTENPSFEVNSALLSRCKVVVLKALSEEDLGIAANRALKDENRGLGGLKLGIDEKAVSFLGELSMGDARVLLNNLHLAALRAASSNSETISLEDVVAASGEKAFHYDKDGEEHYNLISAFHKSLRGSDPQASLYYLSRMLEGGEDPLYIMRRMVRFASEDIGCADPQALVISLAAMDAVRFLGLPECNTAIAEAVIYLSTAPKSNSVYNAIKSSAKTVKETGHLPVPLKIRNAPTKMMKNLGYGKDYKYPHDYKDGFVSEEYLPKSIKDQIFYKPSTFGFEREISKRMTYWATLKKKSK